MKQLSLRWALRSPWVLALAGTAFFFQRAVLTHEVFLARDMARVYLPLRQYWVDRVSHGEWPQWFAYDGLGQPFLPMVISGALHPSQLLFLLLPVATALKWSVLACYPLMFLGVYALGGKAGLGHAPRVMAAVVHCFGGYAVCLSNNWLYLMGMAMVPWILNAAVALRAAPSWSRAAGVGALLALALYGGDSPTFLVCSALVLCTPLMDAHPARGLRWAAAGVLFGFGFGAVILWPAAAAAGTAGIAEQPLSEVLRWSLHPLRAFDVALGPLFAGDAITPSSARVAREVLQQGTDSLWANSLYIGLPALVLAGVGLFSRARQRATWLVVAATVVLLVLSLGRFGGLYEVLVRGVAAARPFRYPERLFPFLSLSLSLAAGVGLQALRSDERRRRRAALTCAALGLGCGAAALAGRWWAWWPEPLQQEWVRWSAWTCGFGAAAALVLGVLHTQAFRDGAWVAMCFAELFFVNEPLFSLTRPEVVQTPSAFVERMRAVDGENALGRYRLYGAAEYHNRVESPDVTAADEEALALSFSLHSVFPAWWGIESADGYLPAASWRVRRLVNEPALWMLKLLGAFNTRYVTWSTRMRADAASLPGTVVEEDPLLGLQLVRLREVLPRVYLSRPRCVSSFAAAQVAMRASAFSPSRETVVECSAPLGAAAPELELGAVRLTTYAPEEVQVDAEIRAECVLVLSDAFYPGWTATVDGAPVEILAANGAVRAVVLNPGIHRVVFRYRTPRLLWGGAVSGVTGLLAVALALCRRRWFRGALSAPMKG